MMCTPSFQMVCTPLDQPWLRGGWIRVKVRVVRWDVHHCNEKLLMPLEVFVCYEFNLMTEQLARHILGSELGLC